MRNTAAARAIIAAVFFVSGAAALIYEILWSRQFVTVFGNSAYSISIVLCAFMAGLGTGGLFFGRRADRTSDPLGLYALLEAGIALTALLVPLLLDVLRAVTPGLFALLPGDVLSVSLVRLLFSFAVLFPPCFLIGGTLPVLARFCVDARSVVGQRIGILYGLNTLGGAFGCFLAGYFLLESLGIAGTGKVAAASNAGIALAALLVRKVLGPAGKGREPDPPADTAAARPEAEHPPHSPPAGLQAEPGPDTTAGGEAEHPPDAPAPACLQAETEHAAAGGGKQNRLEETPSRPPARLGKAVLLPAAFLSGFTALACEVLWTRFLSFVCHSNPYTFTAILGFCLVGLALGSLVYRFFLARIESRFLLLGIAEILIGAALLAALLLGSWLIVSHGPKAQVRILGAGVFRGLYLWPAFCALLFAFVPAMAMGIVFPLVCAAFTRSLDAVGRSVGLVYGLNTAGCIAGSLAPVFLLIPLIGIQGGLTAIALFSGAAGAVVAGLSGILDGGRWKGPRTVAGAAAAIAILAAAGAAPEKLAQKVFLQGVMSVGPQSEIVFCEEGRTGSSMVVRDRIDGMLDLYINSVNEVPTTFLAQGIFRLMGHLGPLLCPNPREALAICFGGGIAGGALNLHPEVRTLDMVEIESSVIDGARHLAKENNDLLESPKLSVFIEDGRNFLLTRKKKYPVILCDSTHPKSADSWVLYTREFYETVDRRLDDPGVFIQWIPYHGMAEAEYRIIARTFQSVFPHASLWVLYGYNERGLLGGHTLLAAMKPKLDIDVAAMAKKLADPRVRADLAPFQMDTPLKILRHFVCGEERLRQWTKGLPVNTDDLPLTQYRTAYSEPPECFHTMFIPLLESPRPFLANTGGPAESARLKKKLDLCMKVRRLTMEGKWKDAHDLMPDDDKLNLFEGIYAKAVRWRKMKELYYTAR